MTKETIMCTTGYEAPLGIRDDDYYEIIYAAMNLAKEKGLTVRQAQKLFIDCSDAVLSAKL